ncbi:hypothetical protein ACWJJH_02510 [Endozoicomonadaceae bacterium StTr2]
MKQLLITISALALTGCNLLSSGLKTESETMRASVSGDMQEIGMFATEANARVIIANVNEGRFCAEPSPETQSTESNSMRLMLEAAKDSRDDQVKLEAFRTYSQGLRQLYRRSHTNQLYRDSSYYLCQAYLNGALTDDDIVLFLGTLISEPDNPAQEAFNTSIEEAINRIASSKSGRSDEAATKGAYLTAQLILSHWAFDSLKNEVDHFYKEEAKVNEGKAIAYKEGIDQMNANITTLEAKVEAVNSKANSTYEKTSDNSVKLDNLKQDINNLPKPATPASQ